MEINLVIYRLYLAPFKDSLLPLEAHFILGLRIPGLRKPSLTSGPGGLSLLLGPKRPCLSPATALSSWLKALTVRCFPCQAHVLGKETTLPKLCPVPTIG